jgi:hypothetical protein
MSKHRKKQTYKTAKCLVAKIIEEIEPTLLRHLGWSRRYEISAEI